MFSLLLAWTFWMLIKNAKALTTWQLLFYQRPFYFQHELNVGLNRCKLSCTANT